MMVQSKPVTDRPKPSIHVDESDLPDIKNWTVGKKYKVSAHVEMQNHSKGDSWGGEDGKKKHSARLIVHSIKADGGNEN